jgi:uncharacterized protein YkwD
VIALLLALWMIAAPPPPPAYCHSVRARINVVRQHYGLSPLAESPRLHVAAQGWADTNPTRHGHWIRRIRAAGVAEPDLGEVIAWGFHDARSTVRAWMLSPKHRRVLLEPDSFFQHDGAGCHWDGTRMFAVVDFSGS